MTRGFHLGRCKEDIVAHRWAGNIDSRDRGDLTNLMVANCGGENTVSRDHRGGGSMDSLYSRGGEMVYTRPAAGFFGITRGFHLGRHGEDIVALLSGNWKQRAVSERRKQKSVSGQAYYLLETDSCFPTKSCFGALEMEVCFRP
jgi:hypothetical protein